MVEVTKSKREIRIRNNRKHRRFRECTKETNPTGDIKKQLPFKLGWDGVGEELLHIIESRVRCCSRFSTSFECDWIFRSNQRSAVVIE